MCVAARWSENYIARQGDTLNFGMTAMNILTRALRSALNRPRRDPALEYLNESVSLIDLERRQQEIDAGAFSRRRYGY